VKIQESYIDIAEKKLLEVFQKIPFLKIVSISREKEGIDFLVTVVVGNLEKTLIIEVKNNGQPRIVRMVVNQLVRYKNSYPDACCIFMAPYISSKSAEICLEDGIGYVDFAGNCYLTFGQVYIEQQGAENPFRSRRDLISLYSPKTSRILRVLLTDPGRLWKTQLLADEAQVSLGLIANVKKMLLDREWITEGNGFYLSEPLALINDWATVYSYKKNDVRNFYSLKSIPELESEIASICNEKGIKYALTGFSGAARFAPNVRYNRAMFYINDSVEEVVSLLELKEVNSGANLMLLTPYDEGVFYGLKVLDEISIVSPFQIYLDLKGIKGRGEEAAEFLMNEIIKPQLVKKNKYVNSE